MTQRENKIIYLVYIHGLHHFTIFITVGYFTIVYKYNKNNKSKNLLSISQQII